MRLLITILILAASTSVFGQTEALYSQYMFNGLTINPAYAGSQQSLSLSALSRLRSKGLPGSPSTQTFSAHNALNEQKIGLGLTFMNDRVGITNQTGAYFSYAYKISFDNGSVLSLGLQGGGTIIDANFSELLIDDPNDPNFAEDLREFKPNFGTGVYYSSQKMYLGVSMPQMLDIGDERLTQSRPFIVTGGLIFELNPVLKLKPNFLVRVVDNQVVEYNINSNLLIHDVLWLGFSYRHQNTFNSLIEIQVTDKFRLGYAYDMGLSDYRTANSGTHEFMVNYQLRFNKKGVVNPRYF